MDTIKNKTNFYKKYITDKNLHQLIANSKTDTYDIDHKLEMYFLFNKIGISYDNFYCVAQYFYNLGTSKKEYIRKTAFYDFKNKFSNSDIHNDILADYNNDFIKKSNKQNHNDEPLVTKTIVNILIDSTTISNEQNSNIATITGYKNKRGIKVHILAILTDQNKISPLFHKISGAHEHDHKFGISLLEEFESFFKSETNKDKNLEFVIMADKGYDSIEFRKIASHYGKCIVPENKRNIDSKTIKLIKEEATLIYKEKRNQLMIDQKNATKKIKINTKKMKAINKLKKKVKDDNALDLLIKEFTDLDKQINETKLIVSNIKTQRKNINSEKSKSIKCKIIDINKKECTCTHQKYECYKCKTKTVCDICDKCSECEKCVKYYKNMTIDEIHVYKSRIRIEHLNSIFKRGRINKIKDRNLNMLKDTINNRFTDFLFFKNQNG